MTIQGLINRLEKIDVYAIAFDILKNYEDDLIYAQKNQLAAGQDLSGELMKPTILEDPYFEGDRKKAENWIKRKKQPPSDFGNKPPEVANLIYSTGDMIWRQIIVKYTGKKIHLGIAPEMDIQEELEQKYGDLFGLNPKGLNYIYKAFFINRFCEEFVKQLFG